MLQATVRVRRNLFEIENAKNLTPDEIVATFVPTKSFWRLLSAKNHVILGARGSGKTVLAKMLSHDHLSQFRHPQAQRLVDAKAFIGIYVPTNIEWVGSLKNKPWQSEAESERLFSWRLNLASCSSFLITLRSCLDMYISDIRERAVVESELVPRIAEAWSDGACASSTTSNLQSWLGETDYRKQQQLARWHAIGSPRRGEEPVGLSFAMELFAPLRRAIGLTEHALAFPNDTTWLLCIDETEFLEPLHLRILNTHLRSSSRNLVFKMTTMPYEHKTDTNAKVSLNVGHDFEYVYIDQDPIVLAASDGIEGREFAIQLFMKRAVVSTIRYRHVELRELLGPSPLLDQKQGDWGPTSEQMSLLRRYASEETLRRAERLSGQPREFMDQIARKVHGALILRHAVESLRGRGELDVYAGEAMAIRCGDANPRRLIRIFNSFLLELRWGNRRRRLRQLLGREQTRILTAFATSTLTRVQSEKDCGPELYAFLTIVGEYMRRSLHVEPLSTDQISSIQLDQGVPRRVWDLVQRAVGLGLLFPNVGANNPDQMPEGEGTFHLAYVLAPHFKTLPRRGRARRLTTIMRAASASSAKDVLQGQNSLFEHGEEP